MLMRDRDGTDRDATPPENARRQNSPHILDIERLRAAPLSRDPFEHVVVEDFVRPERFPEVLADFPEVARHGSFPLASLSCGPALDELAGEMTGPALRSAIEEKFAIDLAGRPTMITLRGRSDGRDGGIHTDSTTKIVTLLLYLNPVWEPAEGRLRLLRGPADLSDYAVEIPPVAGTMLAFLRSERSWHGHLGHIGERRSLQLNWVTGAGVVRRETGRHRWSARLKSLNPFG